MVKPPKPATRIKPVADEDDAHYWRALAATVKPIRRALLAVLEPPPLVRPVKLLAKTAKPAKPESLPKALPVVAPKLPQPDLTNMDGRNAERLRRGEMAIDGRIDLHGMTEASAHSALVSYLNRSAAAGLRCILVITGKGKVASRRHDEGDRLGPSRGILRSAAPRWLKEPGMSQIVLAFTAARPRHGGEGALYVLLRRRRAPEQKKAANRKASHP